MVVVVVVVVVVVPGVLAVPICCEASSSRLSPGGRLMANTRALTRHVFSLSMNMSVSSTISSCTSTTAAVV
jgi:hypothetical protein